MSNITVQVLEIDLYDGDIIRNEQVPVNLSNHIPTQCFPPDESEKEDKESMKGYNDWIGQFKSTAQGYSFKGEETLYLIILPKSK